MSPDDGIPVRGGPAGGPVGGQENQADADRPRATSGALVNAMTVDIEDYFQVGAFADTISRDDWDGIPGRVEMNTDRLLRLFDGAGVRVTFFTLGWIAERYPRLIRRIVAAGHELASHGYAHWRVDGQAVDEFRDDVRRTRLLLEDAGGVAVTGYRAASFSMGPTTPWAHQVLAEEGYRYSSSIFPVRHDHYGVPDAPRLPYRPAGQDGVIELPLTTLRLFGRNLPCAGGGYFRLLPYAYFRWAIGRFNRRDRAAAIFYFHPWEIDPGQPRQAGLGAKTRFRHYVNLGAMERKLQAVLGDFSWDRMDRVFSVG